MNLDPRLKQGLFALVALSFLPAVLGWLAAALLFAPNPTPVPQLPDDLSGETVRFETRDGVALRAWYLPPAAGPIRGGVLLLHCRGCNRASMLNRARFLLGEGYAVLLPDLRGEGESEAIKRGMGLYEARDVEASLFELRRRVGALPVAIIGRSKGAAAAVYAHPEVDALVLESMYTDFLGAIENRVADHLGEWARGLSFLAAGPLAFGMGINRHEAVPLRHLEAIETPVMLVGGDRDPLAPWDDTQRLFDAAPGLKRLWRIPGMGHVDAYDFAPADWRREVGDFLAMQLAGPSPGGGTSGAEVRPVSPGLAPVERAAEAPPDGPSEVPQNGLRNERNNGPTPWNAPSDVPYDVPRP